MLPLTGSRGLWVAAWLAGLALALAGTIALVAAVPVLAQEPAPLTQCFDEVDNDGDGATDYPADPGCVLALDDDEIDPPTQCFDGVDNDGDGATDYPADPGCVSALDDDETDLLLPAPQCSDARDNDADAATDYPADPGCVSALDNDEMDPPLPPSPACSDASDNDADGRTDYGSDPGCESPSDTSEVDPTPVAAASQPPQGLSPFPVVRLAGRILRRGVRVRLLTVQAPSGSKIAIGCHGPHASCPYATTDRLSIGAVVRVRPFERRLSGGTVLRIYVTKKGFVGKYTRFEIRSRRAPKRTDECARWAGARMPCP